MKNAITVLVLSALFISNCSLTFSEDASKGRPYKLGIILPMSGEGSSLGTYAKRAIDLAYSELTPEEQARLKLYFEDGSLDPKKSVSAFQMLSSTNNIDGVVALTSGIGHALAPIAERQKTLMIDIGGSDKTFAVGKQFVFIHWISPESEIDAMVKEVKNRGYNRIAMISIIHQGAAALADAFVKKMKQEGLQDKIVFKEEVEMGMNDFNSLLAKAKAAKPDSFYLVFFGDTLAAISEKIKELKIPGEIFGAETFEDAHVIEASHGGLLGAWYTNAADPESDFTAKYKAKYNEQPGITTANAYDVIHLLTQAIAKNGNDNKKLAGFFKTLKDYHGACGTYSATDDNRFTLTAAVKIVTKDGFSNLVQH